MVLTETGEGAPILASMGEIIGARDVESGFSSVRIVLREAIISSAQPMRAERGFLISCLFSQISELPTMCRLMLLTYEVISINLSCCFFISIAWSIFLRS